MGSRPVTVTQLRNTLGSRLLNIHGQHDGQQLLDEEQHLSYLDRFGRTEAAAGSLSRKIRPADIRRQMQALEMDEAEKARRVDTLTYQLQELERTKLRPGEEEELQSRRTCCTTRRNSSPPCPGRTSASTATTAATVPPTWCARPRSALAHPYVWTPSWESCTTGWRRVQ